ncbi:MAG: ATP-binding protein [Planctomycetota bacterium]|nr:ATP-binding protein [Planctomycetota bacterium]
MTDSAWIDQETFAAVFPFGFAASAEGTLEWVGNSLKRHMTVRGGTLLSDVVQVLQPLGCTADKSMVCGPGRTVRLRVEELSLELRGHAFWFDGEERFAFVGSPLVRSLEELEASGLKLADFDPSDATPDMLMSMQSARTSLEDARSLGEELRVALSRAEVGMAVKSRFLAVMSHEIRTPLNGFGSMLDLLLEDPTRYDAGDLLRTMDDSARGLMTLLNDILDFSKLEDGSVRIESRSFSVEAVLKAATSPFARQAKAAGVELRVNVARGVPRTLLGDPYRVRQIVSNLTGNAVRFTERGRITVDAQRDGNELVITVEDTGRGISPAAEANLFEPFSQGDVSTTREYGGTGLGLTISRELARALEGDLQLTRTSEAGSIFTLRLPCVEAPDTTSAKSEGSVNEESPARRARFDGVDVLVVDDNPTNRLVIDRLLSRLGVTVHPVEGGQKALELLGARPYDLVLMDIMMPGMDGNETTRRVRDLDVAWRGLPVVALSAAVFDEDRDAALLAGMDDFLEKPVRLDVLEETLVRHCGRPRELQG